MKALNYEINIKELSPQLQVLIGLEVRQNALEKKLYEKPVQMTMTFDPVDAQPLQTPALVVPSTFISAGDWRKDMNTLICAVARIKGDYSVLRTKVYRELEARMRCNLAVRLSNLKKNMLYNGASKTEAENKNYLDVIEKDPRLVSCYITIVKEMARANNIRVKN